MCIWRGTGLLNKCSTLLFIIMLCTYNILMLSIRIQFIFYHVRSFIFIQFFKCGQCDLRLINFRCSHFIFLVFLVFGLFTCSFNFTFTFVAFLFCTVTLGIIYSSNSLRVWSDNSCLSLEQWVKIKNLTNASRSKYIKFSINHHTLTFIVNLYDDSYIHSLFELQMKDRQINTLSISTQLCLLSSRYITKSMEWHSTTGASVTLFIIIL